jgi:hypothetical protein
MMKVNCGIRLASRIDTWFVLKRKLKLAPLKLFSIDEKAHRCECVVACELE